MTSIQQKQAAIQAAASAAVDAALLSEAHEAEGLSIMAVRRAKAEALLAATSALLAEPYAAHEAARVAFIGDADIKRPDGDNERMWQRSVDHLEKPKSPSAEATRKRAQRAKAKATTTPADAAAKLAKLKAEAKAAETIIAKAAETMPTTTEGVKALADAYAARDKAAKAEQREAERLAKAENDAAAKAAKAAEREASKAEKAETSRLKTEAVEFAKAEAEFVLWCKQYRHAIEDQRATLQAWEPTPAPEQVTGKGAEKPKRARAGKAKAKAYAA